MVDARWACPRSPYKAERGTLFRYIRNVRTASEGGVTDD
jgi:hypothetical protein